jgi:hypothetical protein
MGDSKMDNDDALVDYNEVDPEDLIAGKNPKYFEQRRWESEREGLGFR